MAAFPERESRLRVADALARVIENGFRNDATLLSAVRDWIGFAEGAPPPPPCAVCGRQLAGFVVEPGAFEPRLLVARNAGTRAVCSPCILLAMELLGVEPYLTDQKKADAARPRWDMVHAELERALALLSEDDAAIARACLAERPRAAKGECAHCVKSEPALTGRKGGFLCGACARSARSTYEDIGLRSELERGDTTCPECGSHDVSAAPLHIEFTVMTCLSCGHSQTCDVWDLMDWH